MEVELATTFAASNSELQNILGRIANLSGSDPRAMADVGRLADLIAWADENLAILQAEATQDRQAATLLAQYGDVLRQIVPVVEKYRSVLLARQAELEKEKACVAAASSWASRHQESLREHGCCV